MAVRADKHISWPDKAAFRQQGVFHATVAALVIVREILFPRKAAAHHDLVGGIDVFLGRKMIHDKKDFVPVKDLRRSHAVKRLDRQRAGNVIGKHPGQTAPHNLAVAADLVIRMGLQNLLGKRLCHWPFSLRHDVACLLLL